MSRWRAPTGLLLAVGLALGSVWPGAAPGIPTLAVMLLVLGACGRLRTPHREGPGVALLVLLSGAAMGAFRAPEGPGALGGPPEKILVAGRIEAWDAAGTGIRVRLQVHRMGDTRFAEGVPVSCFAPDSWGGEPKSPWIAFRARWLPERGATNPGAWAPETAARLLPDDEGEPRWGPGSFPWDDRLRGMLKKRLEVRWTGFPRRLAAAMLLGRSSALEPEEREVFRRAGASHLVAVSGLHIGLVALLGAMVAAPFGRGAVLVVAGAGAASYAALAGWSPSATRASVMVAAVLFGSALGRPRPPIAWLCLALPWLLWGNPALAGSIGFRMSVGAVAGIVFFLEIAGIDGAGIRARIAGPIVTSLGAQWGTLPSALATFGTLAPLATLPNLVAIPLAGLFLPATLLGLLPDLPGCPEDLFPAAASLLARGIRASLAASAGELPYLAMLPVPPGPVLLLVPAILIAWFGLRRDWRRTPPARALALGLAGTALCLLLAPWPPPRGPWILFLDVGQGDAALMALPDGTHWIVDVGDDRGPGDGARNALLPALRSMRVRRVDGLILTHRHRDHVGSLGPLLEAIRVEAVYEPAVVAERAAVDSVLRAHDLLPGLAAAGDTLHAWPGGALVAVHPERPGERDDPPRDLNDHSLVVAVSAPGWDVLLTGDMEAPAERACLERGGIGRARILKVAHHGSRTSSREEFLERLAPEIAVISCGERNRYGHPSAEVLARLRRRGVAVHRTDRDGAVLIVPGVSGSELDVKLHPPRARRVPTEPR